MSQTDTGVKANSKSGAKKSPNEHAGRKSISDCQLFGVFCVFIISLIFATYIGSWLGKFTVEVNIVDWFNVYTIALSSSSGSWTWRDLPVRACICAEWRHSGAQQLSFSPDKTQKILSHLITLLSIYIPYLYLTYTYQIQRALLGSLDLNLDLGTSFLPSQNGSIKVMSPSDQVKAIIKF